MIDFYLLTAMGIKISHASITFGETLGKGQFGDVFKGIYTDKVLIH